MLERCFILFLDEALFHGDRKSADALKSIATEPFIAINPKHQPVREVRSLLRIFAATNADHWKHTERDDRRDFVLRVSEHRQGDKAWWTAVYNEIDGGGVEAMAHELLTLDLSDFDVRAKPSTRAFTEQKVMSLQGFDRWWFNALDRGSLQAFLDEWPEHVATSTLLAEFNNSERNPRQQLDERGLGGALLRVCPKATRKQKTKSDGARGCGKEPRSRGYILPDLAQCRRDFETLMRAALDWSDP